MIIALVPKPTTSRETMTNKEAIANLKSHWTADGWVEDYWAMDMAIESLEKTADKECSRCTHRDKCAIFDNFNIDYCSDWSDEE